jgi:glycosyltransferase involved in cell wall biosynthesis
VVTTTLAPRLLRPDGLPIDFDPDVDAPLEGPSVLALVGGRGAVCNLWRIWQPFASLQVRGYRAEWAWHEDEKTAPYLPHFDAYLLCRSLWSREHWKGAARWFKSTRALGKKVFYECDDDLFSAFMVDQQIKGISKGQTAEQLREEAACQLWSLRQCDGVTVSTQRLATVVRGLTDKPVVVVPNAIDAEWFQGVQATARRTVPGLTIGWAGGNRPDGDLAEMAVAWGRLAKRYKDVTFVVMGHQPGVISEHVPESRLKRLPWMHFAEYPKGLVNVDIGCCPLEDKPFNRCKTPIKAWEYALSGAAVVASPTVYTHAIRDSFTGFLARDAQEWEFCLSRLIEDEGHRRQMAADLRADVLAKWSLRKNFRRWPDAWLKLWTGAA